MQNGVELLFDTIELRRRRLRQYRRDACQRHAGSKNSEARMQHRTPIRSGVYLRAAGGRVPKPSAGAGVMVTPSSDRPGAMFGRAGGSGSASGVPTAEASYVGLRLAGTDESGADAIGREVAGLCGRRTNTVREAPAPITIQRNSRS